MPKNESKGDRIARAILGLVFLYLAAATFVGVWSIVFYVLAIVMIVTAITGFCALYKLIGITTIKK